jgi:hypothetical protein
MRDASASDGGGRAAPDLRGLKRPVDIFAEYLACEFTVFEAAQAMALPVAKGLAMLTRVRKALGWQAV